MYLCTKNSPVPIAILFWHFLNVFLDFCQGTNSTEPVVYNFNLPTHTISCFLNFRNATLLYFVENSLQAQSMLGLLECYIIAIILVDLLIRWMLSCDKDKLDYFLKLNPKIIKILNMHFFVKKTANVSLSFPCACTLATTNF